MKRIQKLISMLEFQSIDSTDKYFKLDVREVYKAYKQVLAVRGPDRDHTPDKRWTFDLNPYDEGMYVNRIWYQNDKGDWCVYVRPGGAGFGKTPIMKFYSGDPKNFVTHRELTSKLHALYMQARKKGMPSYY